MDIKRLLLCPVLLLNLSCLADLRPEFDAAYEGYLQHVQDEKWELALEAAERSWNLGLKVFGEDNINAGNLSLNYARLLNRFERPEEAEPLLKKSLKILGAHHGKSAPELLDVLMELGQTSLQLKDDRAARSHFNRAIRIIPDEQSIFRANMMMEAGILLQRHLSSGTKYFESAHEIYSKAVGPEDIRTALAALYVARLEIARGDYEEARELLESAAETFAQPAAGARNFELTARGHLVHVLEELGESELATRQCRIIGSKTPPVPNEKYFPVYKRGPDYPHSALRNGVSGWVIVEFTVDDQGFTRDHKIVESSAPVFDDASIASARTFRYAPQFKDGKPVITEHVRNKITFDIVD